MDVQPPQQAAAITLETLAGFLQRNDRLIGLDLGEKTIGVALSDVERRIATAYSTIMRKKFGTDAAELLAIAEKQQVTAFILGLPLNMDGSSGPRVQATRAFARNLAQLTTRPILFWDERLSTVAAERALISADMSRKKRAAVIDATAAAFILQGALDRLRSLAQSI